jgi:cell division protein FtsI/penicillin-binding protein 2
MDAALPVPSRLHAPPLASVRPRPEDSALWGTIRKDAKGRILLRRGGQWTLTTLDARLHDELNQLLKSYQTPYAAVVALEPATGRILAMAEHAEAAPQLKGLTLRALFPAASIFKIVTAAALLDAGVKPEDEACFHGGKRRVSERMLEDSPRDRQCASLAEALARSTNGVFVKLVHQHLSAAALRSWVKAFRFNEPLAIGIPLEPSLAAIPDDSLGLAAAGAGFGDVFLSPLHGALLASVAANRGAWRSPVLWEDTRASTEPSPRVVSPEVAAQLTEMMEGTVLSGTARRVFRKRGFQVKGAVGKTGSLADRNPFRDYSWFVGFAPKDDPQVAVAAVVVNDARWRIRATFVGREAMRLYLSREASAVAVGR